MTDQQELQEEMTGVKIKVLKRDLSTAIAATGVTISPKLGYDVVKVEDLHHVAIPKTMDKLDAAFNLLKQFEEEETYRNYNRNYTNFFLNDFLVAMEELIEENFGMLHVSKRNTAGQPASPDYIQVPIGFKGKNLVTKKGYIGSIICPVWDNCIMDINPNQLIIKSKLKHEVAVNKFLESVEQHIKTKSIVKGKAVKLQPIRGGFMAEPINPVINERIVLKPDTERLVNNIIIPTLKKAKKSSMLFIGDFGTGKTETAIKIGIKARDLHNRTFFYLHDCSLFPALIPYLKNYNHALVFCEDIDQISAGDRDSNMNQLLNQLDGNELKNVDCAFIFTTNSHDKIHSSMRRPGRIDQIVQFDTCDAEMVAKIFEIYGSEMRVDGVIDYAKLGKLCTPPALPKEVQGAVITEVAVRAQDYANQLHEGVISTSVFEDAIASMKYQIDFMQREQKKDHSMENLLGHVVFKSFKKAFPNIENGTVAGAPFPNFTQSQYAGLDS